MCVQTKGDPSAKIGRIALHEDVFTLFWDSGALAGKSTTKAPGRFRTPQLNVRGPDDGWPHLRPTNQAPPGAIAILLIEPPSSQRICRLRARRHRERYAVPCFTSFTYSGIRSLQSRADSSVSRPRTCLNPLRFRGMEPVLYITGKSIGWVAATHSAKGALI